MKRVPELDGIRGVAIGLVLFCHFVVIQIAAPPATFWSCHSHDEEEGFHHASTVARTFASVSAICVVN